MGRLGVRSTRPTTWERVAQRYLSIDARTLGATRIYLGSFLLADLVHRGGSWFALYADDGVLGRAYQSLPVARPSLLWFAGTHLELGLVYALIALIYLALLLGFWTRLANVLAFFAWTSMSRRLPIATNSGYVVMSLVLLWTSLLPMGKRFSLDALRASLARHPEARVADLADREKIGPDQDTLSSLTALAVILQIATIYFFNAAMKYGEAWKNLTAVHYVLHDNEFVTPLAGLVRDHLPVWLYKALAMSTLVVEYTIGVGVLVPSAWSRRIAYTGIVGLHVGFALMMLLGPFSWACCALAALLVPREDWDLAGAALRRRHRARTVAVDENDPRALRFARLLARLDRFDLLRFEPGERGRGIRTRDAAGQVVDGRRAIAASVAALPLGPILAPLLTTPLGDIALPVAAGFTRWLERVPPSAVLRRPAFAGTALTLVEVSTAALMVIATGQALSDIDILKVRYHYERPWFVAEFAEVFGMNQSWQLFAPSPTKRTRFTIVDAETRDGRHIDTFTGLAPLTRFDEPVAREGLPEFWVDYLRKQFETDAYYEPMRAFVLRYGERTGKREDEIVRARAYLLVQNDPAFGETVAGPPVEHLMWTTWEKEVQRPHPEDQPPPRR